MLGVYRVPEGDLRERLVSRAPDMRFTRAEWAACVAGVETGEFGPA